MEGPELHYWLREGKADNAEIDFIVEISREQYSGVIPIEVKSGSAGRLRSLHLFIETCNPQIAVRFYNGLPSTEKFSDIELVSLPLYMVPFLKKILSPVNADCQC